MNHIPAFALIAVTSAVALPAPAHACQPLNLTAFEEIAPTATSILALQIESLELDPEAARQFVHAIKGKIRVLRRYRGAASDYQWLRYDNTLCHGRRLDVGGIYLVATNSSPPFIELSPTDESILVLSGAYPHDPEAVLRSSPTIERVRAALGGNGDFKVSTEGSKLHMSRELPPPDVPPPEHSPEDAALLALPWKQFDQTLGSGWRVYAARNEHRKAAELIKTYLNRRRDLTTAQRAISSFHAAAELARESLTDEALEYLEEAEAAPGLSGVPEDWNELVISTRAFLVGDRAALLESKRRVDAMRSPAFPGAAERLLEHLGQRYGVWDEEPSGSR